MIRFAVVGTNFVTERFLLEAGGNPLFRLVSVHSRDPRRAAAFAHAHGAERFCSDTDVLAADDGVDAVYLAVPNSCHADLAVKFLSHGKAVLCEKPFASNVREAERMIRAAQTHGQLLMEAYMTRFLPVYETLSQAIRDIGAIRSASVTFAKRSSRYDAYRRGEPVRTFSAQYANGAMMDLGVYAVHPYVDWFGMPQDVFAEGTIGPDGVDLSSDATLIYPGFSAEIHVSKTEDRPFFCEIRGEKGTILTDRISEPTFVKICMPDGRTEDRTPPQPLPVMRYEADEFLALLQAGATSSKKLPLSCSWNAMAVLDAVRSRLGVRYPADEREIL